MLPFLTQQLQQQRHRTPWRAPPRRAARFRSHVRGFLVARAEADGGDASLASPIGAVGREIPRAQLRFSFAPQRLDSALPGLCQRMRIIQQPGRVELRYRKYKARVGWRIVE